MRCSGSKRGWGGFGDLMGVGSAATSSVSSTSGTSRLPEPKRGKADAGASRLPLDTRGMTASGRSMFPEEMRASAGLSSSSPESAPARPLSEPTKPSSLGATKKPVVESPPGE